MFLLEFSNHHIQIDTITYIFYPIRNHSCTLIERAALHTWYTLFVKFSRFSLDEQNLPHTMGILYAPTCVWRFIGHQWGAVGMAICTGKHINFQYLPGMASLQLYLTPNLCQAQRSTSLCMEAQWCRLLWIFVVLLSRQHTPSELVIVITGPFTYFPWARSRKIDSP